FYQTLSLISTLIILVIKSSFTERYRQQTDNSTNRSKSGYACNFSRLRCQSILTFQFILTSKGYTLLSGVLDIRCKFSFVFGFFLYGIPCYCKVSESWGISRKIQIFAIFSQQLYGQFRPFFIAVPVKRD